MVNLQANTFELVRKAQAGDKLAKEQLVVENSGLVWSIARRFTGRGYELDDLYQIGAIGLIKCIEKFDTNFGVKFSTYAVPMILGEIRRFLRDDGMIKIARPLKELAVKARYAHQKHLQETGKAPTVDELAATLDATPENLLLALESGFDVESLHSKIMQGDGQPIYLLDRLASNNNDDDKMVDNIALRQLIDELDEKSRTVIQMRYFQDKTQMEVAAAIGVSQVQVSRIEKKVLEILRRQMM
ncbi:MAG: SigF/SigG family RNA polymerase sporulation sigma factor [Defluviitaleaceae bacterium]|nr:SigF/SigG family RNA polymerase sporulation sigma factor [Defluviitaleaceae bacterium]